MDTIGIILIMLFLIIVSNIIYKWTPRISIPLLQILLGALLALLPFSINLHIESEMFMLLFIAPILFMDGKKFSNRELWDFKRPILYMSLGLVFLTILICGYIIYLLVTDIPLPVAFALAAVLSPTDAVAVKAISSKINLPHNVTTIVEGESLLNDASGLVAFNFAIAAHLTGVFSIRDVTIRFMYVAFGGVILGALAGYIINVFTQKLKSMGIEEPAVYTLLQIMAPFTVFLIAEELNLSGILAVVACGVAISLTKPDIMTMQEANIRHVSDGAWTTFLFVLNGLIFIMLGMILPTIFAAVAKNGENSIFKDISYIFIISLLLITIRYIWVYLFIGNKHDNRAKNAVLISLSGVRGALTLAACLSIPLVIDNGMEFPQRDLILFISSGVIIVTLVIANVLLPIISPSVKSDNIKSELEATKVVIQSALELIKKETTQDNKEVANLLIRYYDYLLKELLHKKKRNRKFIFKPSPHKKGVAIFKAGVNSESEEVKKLLSKNILDKDELEFRAIEIQKLEVQKLLEQGEISHEVAYKLRRNICLEEAALFECDNEKE